MTGKLLLALTFDTDADPGETLQNPTWRNLKHIGTFFDELRSWFNRFKEHPKTTWFVRVDNQVESVYGQRDGLLIEHEADWKEIVAAGGEIGFHPHLYEKLGHNFRRAHGKPCLQAELREDIECASEWRKFRVRSSRIGEAYHDNDLMNVLAGSGLITQDCTAMSGRVVDSELKIDWACTPNVPYYPSQADYRVPGEPHLSILEIPMTMVRTRASYDAAVYSRYLNPAFHAGCFTDLKADVEHVDYIMTVTHLFELYPTTKQAHGLLSYSVENYFEVLNSLVRSINDLGKSIVFVTPSQLGDQFRGT